MRTLMDHKGRIGYKTVEKIAVCGCQGNAADMKKLFISSGQDPLSLASSPAATMQISPTLRFDSSTLNAKCTTLQIRLARDRPQQTHSPSSIHGLYSTTSLCTPSISR